MRAGHRDAKGMKATNRTMVVLGVLCALALGLAQTGSPADSIVAAVGDQLILSSEVEQAVDFLRVSSPDTTLGDSALRASVVDRLIDDYVLAAEAETESIEVTPQEVSVEVDANLATLIERFGGQEQYQAALAAEGLTEKTLRSRYEDESRRKLISRRLLDKAGLTQIYVSPGEAERYYNENKDSISIVPGQVVLAHILFIIKPSPGAESTGMRRMNEVLDVLTRGGDFATVAGSFSDDRKTSGKGGDWGWKTLMELPMDLGMVASQLKVGQVAPPFRTLDGYIVMRLDDKQGDRVRLRSILIRVPVTRADSARALERANSARRKLMAGAPFDSLARKLSEDPTTADSGGYLGQFMIKGLTKPFDAVVAGMDSGQVSEPVLSEHGYHLVKVLMLQKERQMTYLDMQDGIRNYLYQQQLNSRLRDYLARISKKVYIKRYS